MKENKTTKEKDIEIKLVHTGTQIVAPWNFLRDDEKMGYKE